MVASWKPPKDRNDKDYPDKLQKRLAEIDLAAKKTLPIIVQMAVNIKMDKANRYATPLSREQLKSYIKDVRKDIKNMFQAISQLDKEYKEYEKHMKKKKAKPIKRVEQAWKKYLSRVEPYKKHVVEIEKQAGLGALP